MADSPGPAWSLRLPIQRGWTPWAAAPPAEVQGAHARVPHLLSLAFTQNQGHGPPKSKDPGAQRPLFTQVSREGGLAHFLVQTWFHESRGPSLPRLKLLGLGSRPRVCALPR